MSKRRAHYCVSIANRICEHIALGHGLPKALELTGGLAPSIPMFYRWLEEYPEFLERYRRAREFQAHTHADIILDIATQAMVPANAKMVPGFRLAVDVFKWNAEMRLPEQYSPKAAQEVKKPPKTPEAIKEEIARLSKELGMKEMPQPGMVTAKQTKPGDPDYAAPPPPVPFSVVGKRGQ
jgi:hypothetical protein